MIDRKVSMTVVQTRVQTSVQTKGQKRKAEIISVARSVLIADGYDCFVMRDIADRVGIKLGNLQYYFPTCEDLVEAVARAESHRTLEVIREIGGRPGNPTEKLTRLVREIVHQWEDEGGKIFVVVSVLAMHNPRFRRLHRGIYEQFYGAFCDVLSEFEPGASRTNLMVKARLVTSLLDGALWQIPIEPGRGNKKTMDEFLAELSDAALRLLGYGS